MESALRFHLLLVLVLVGQLASSSMEDDFELCEIAVKNWASSSQDEVKEDKHRLQDLLFFLHIPRTGGRAYHHCFLKKLYSRMLQCPLSYDKLSFNPRQLNCRLLATHDDCSVLSKLPKSSTSVFTIMRNPVDRVFSTYEFSIEVAARFLVHPNLTSATQLSSRVLKKTNAVSTLDIWPWRYLVPWMREDLFARRDARMKVASNHHSQSSNNAYNMRGMAMPLHEFIYDPLVLDIVHNGATFQIAGLTNNSYLAESNQVRHCVQKYQVLGKYVLQVAKKRLDNMIYVGLTEYHKESASLFGQVIGAQVISQFEDQLANLGSEQSPLSGYQSNDDSINSSGTASPQVLKRTKTDMSTIGEVMESYKVCITGLRKGTTKRRTRSLAKISPANFTKEGRSKVPESILGEIRELNSLDLELYQYAKEIFGRQHKLMMHESTEERRFSILINSTNVPSLTNAPLAIALSLLLLLYLFVKARRTKLQRLKDKLIKLQPR